MRCRSYSSTAMLLLLLLVASTDAEPDRVMVSAPWLCLVNKIWLIPDGDSYKQPSGTTADVQEWERQQIRQGRVSVTNFQLAVRDWQGCYLLVRCKLLSRCKLPHSGSKYLASPKTVF